MEITVLVPFFVLSSSLPCRDYVRDLPSGEGKLSPQSAAGMPAMPDLTTAFAGEHHVISNAPNCCTLSCILFYTLVYSVYYLVYSLVYSLGIFSCILS